MGWWVLVPGSSSRVLVPRYWFPGTIPCDTECQGWWVDGLMGWWVNEFMDSWVDGYWFLLVVPEYWFPGIGSRVPYPVTQNAGTIHSSPRKPCQNEEIQVWHKTCTECIQMIVFHDSFGEPSKPQNHASHDPKYYTNSNWLAPEK